MADRGDYQRPEGDEEEEDEVDENFYKAQKDALLFAIEISKSMLKDPPPSDEKHADTDNAARATLKAAQQVMQQRIIANPKDKMGIILFGTKKSKFVDADGKPTNIDYPHCYVYTPLDVPSADDVKQLRSLVDDEEDFEDILTPSTGGFEIKDLLFCVKSMFTTQAPNFGSRRLFIVTDNDDPHPGDKNSLEIAKTFAKDLFDLGATIELFPIEQRERKFDLNKFYSDIIYRNSVAEVTEPDLYKVSKSEKGTPLLSSLTSNINSKQTPKRAYFANMPLELGPSLAISVKGYNVLHAQRPARSCYIWLDGEKAQMATSETTRMAEDTTRTVERGEVKKAYKFGGEYVYFSPEEQKSLKQWGDPVIRIIGFKDRSLLKFWMSVKKSIFIFPSEEGYVGSTRVFSALWQKLLKSNKIGIAWHVARANANPVLVAIVPSKSQGDESSGTRYLPAGLWLLPIPFADDIRPQPEYKLIRTTDTLTDKMNMIVRQLQLPNASYHPEKYPNPALQWHYRILQALALEDEPPEEPEDKTAPRVKAIHKRCGGYIEEWSRVADDEYIKRQDEYAVKRELDEDEDEDRRRPPAKKARATVDKSHVNEGTDLTDAVLKKKARSGDLSKMKVTELKGILAVRGLDMKGKKNELVERLEQWAEESI